MSVFGNVQERTCGLNLAIGFADNYDLLAHNQFMTNDQRPGFF
jgi:hypothetical protein